MHTAHTANERSLALIHAILISRNYRYHTTRLIIDCLIDDFISLAEGARYAH